MATPQREGNPYKHGRGLADSLKFLDRMIRNGVMQRIAEGHGDLAELALLHEVVVQMGDAERFFIGWMIDNDRASTAEIGLAVERSQQAIAKMFKGRSKRRGRDWRSR